MAEQEFTKPTPDENAEQQLKTTEKAGQQESSSQSDVRDSEHVHKGKHVVEPKKTISESGAAVEKEENQKTVKPAEDESKESQETTEDNELNATLSKPTQTSEESKASLQADQPAATEQAASEDTSSGQTTQPTTDTSNATNATNIQGQAAAGTSAMTASEMETSTEQERTNPIDDAQQTISPDTTQTDTEQTQTTDTTSTTSEATPTTTDSSQSGTDTSQPTTDVTTELLIPTISALNLSANEDATVNTGISLVGESNAEQLTISISGLPEGATLSAGTETNGVWSLTSTELDGLKINLPADYSGSFDITVNLSGILDDVIKSTSKTFNVDIIPTADTPTLTVSPATGIEDNPIDLNISTALADSSEALSISISQLPGGASLSAGTENPDGSWTLTTAQLDGLQLNLPENYSGEFTLNVTATSTEGDSTASATQNLAVTVSAVADTPTLTVSPATGAEDNALDLDIQSALTDASESLAINVSSLPVGASLSAGTENPDGSWTLTTAQLDGLQLNLPENYSGEFTLNVTATSTEGDSTASATQNLAVTVSAVADTPTLTVSPATGAEDNALDLDIQSALTDSSESLSINVSSLPVGASLSAGTENPDGSWTLTTAQLDGLQLNLPENYSGEFTLNVTATSTEGDSTASATQNLAVTVSAVADTPTLTVSPATGAEDNALDLDIQSALTDSSESLSINVSSLPVGASLSAGTENPDGSWTLTTAQLDGLQLNLPENYSGEFTLNVTATSTEGDSTASATQNLAVTVSAVADTPTLTVSPATGAEDNALDLDIQSALTDASESLSINVSSLPVGASLSAGTENPDGSWTLTTAQLDGLQLNLPENYSGEFTLNVTATSTEGDSTASATQNLAVTVSAVADTPTLTVSPATGAEDNALDLDIQSALTDASESLSINVSSLPIGASLSAGTENPDGSWTLTTAQLDGLQLNPPENYSGEFTLNVTATSTEGDSTASATQNLAVTVSAVADTPTLTVSPATGAEDNALDLDIQSALTDSSESLSINIANLPIGASLSAGINNGDGSWSLTSDQLDGLQFIPPENYSGIIDLQVTAISSEGDSTASSNLEALQITLDPVADAPTLITGNAEGVQGEAIPLSIDSNLVDPSESLEININGVPDDGSLSAGVDNGDGSWTLTADELDNLTYTHTGDTGVVNLTVTATATESDDSTASSTNNLSITVGSGGETFEGTEGKDTYHGTEYNDEIHGLGDFDKLYGEGGDDTIYGDAGNDTLEGGQGNDIIYGGADKDSISGDEGDDELHGDEGDDTIYGGTGEDTIYGDAGKDKIYGGDDNDEIHGGSENDTIRGEGGDDTLYGDAGKDKIYGGDDNDEIHGGSENDTIRGEGGDDTLYGDAGDDTIYGGEGNDTLTGGEGNDTLHGDAGSDTFIFGLNSGHDDIQGGKDGGWTDTIKLVGVSGPPVAEINQGTDWTLDLDKKSADYTIDTDNNVIEFQGGEGKGTIQLSDGSELSFSQIEKIEWQ